MLLNVLRSDPDEELPQCLSNKGSREFFPIPKTVLATHARAHTYALFADNDEHVDTASFPNTGPGRSRAIAWAAGHAGADLATFRSTTKTPTVRMSPGPMARSRT